MIVKGKTTNRQSESRRFAATGNGKVCQPTTVEQVSLWLMCVFGWMKEHLVVVVTVVCVVSDGWNE
jgi:hypothetical protein